MRRPNSASLVGPFTARHLGLAVLSIVVSAAVIAIATRPLGSIDSALLPDPRATAYLVASPTVGFRPGDLAPELAVARTGGGQFELTDLDGHPIRLAELHGKVVWLNFWTSWCAPCQAETPILRDVASIYGERGLALIGVQVQETVEDGRRYSDRYQLPYRIGADVAGDIFRLYRAYALPTHVVIDGDGVIRQVVNGVVTHGRADAIVGPLLDRGMAVR